MKIFILMMLIWVFLVPHAFTQTDDGPSFERIKEIQKEFEEMERPLDYKLQVKLGEKLASGPTDWYWITLKGNDKDFAEKYTLNELAYSLWKYLDRHDDSFHDADAFIILSGKSGEKYLDPSPFDYKAKHEPGRWIEDEFRRIKLSDVKYAVGKVLGHNTGDYGGWEPRKHFFDMTAIIKDKENREKNIQALCAALKDENIRKEYPYEIDYIICILSVLHDKKTIPDIGEYLFFDCSTGKNFINDKKLKGEEIKKLGLRGNCTAPYIISKFGIDALPTVWEKISKTTPFDRSEDGGCAIYMALKILDWAKIDNATALKSLQEYRQPKSLSADENKALDELAGAIKTRDESKMKEDK